MTDVLTAEEVAELLQMDKRWVYGAARSGVLPHVRLGRTVRFRRSAIEAYLAEIEAGGAHPSPPAPRVRIR